MFRNYTYLRNEPILLSSLKCIKPHNRLSENVFLKSLLSSNLPQLISFPMSEQAEQRTESVTRLFEETRQISESITNHLPTLVVIMGGFMDRSHGNAYKLCDVLRKNITEKNSFHLFYREHDEGKDVRLLMEYYAKYACNIILIGHSWGASSLIMHVVKKMIVPIDLLITIDPIGIFRPKTIFRHVSFWLNVYVDYNKANYARYNNVARIGSPWQNCQMANKNISSEILKHHKLIDIFMLYCMENFKQML